MVMSELMNLNHGRHMYKVQLYLGRCRLLEAGPESIARLKEFAMKYYPDETLADEQIARNGRATQMFEITIEHMSGKQVQEK